MIRKGEGAERGALGNVYFLCNVSAEKVNELQELLNKKDQEMKVMEDRYKKYLEKAKSVSCLWFIGGWIIREMEGIFCCKVYNTTHKVYNTIINSQNYVFWMYNCNLTEWRAVWSEIVRVIVACCIPWFLVGPFLFLVSLWGHFGFSLKNLQWKPLNFISVGSIVHRSTSVSNAVFSIGSFFLFSGDKNSRSKAQFRRSTWGNCFISRFDCPSCWKFFLMVRILH